MARTTGVFKRGKVYWIRYSVAGQQFRESTRTTRKAEAEALLHKRQSEIFEGSFFPDRKRNDLTVDGLKDMWLDAAVDKKTIEHDRQRFERVVEHFGPRTLIASLTSEDIDDFKRALRQTKTRLGENMTPATVNRYLALLRSSLRLAARRGYRHREPMAGVKFNRENNQRDRICSTEEYAKLVEAAEPELGLAIMFGYWTGMRLGEIVNLRWKQIDLRERVLRLRRSETKEADAKQVPLARELVEHLHELPRNIDGNVFTRTNVALSGQFGRLCKRLEIDDLRFHDLRHTAVTRLRRAGVDIITIKAITGHKTLKTLERYNKVSVDDLRTAIDRAEEGRH